MPDGVIDEQLAQGVEAAWHLFLDHVEPLRPELFEEQDGRVARISDYCFCPDLVGWVAGEVGLRFRAVGYRFRPRVFERAGS